MAINFQKGGIIRLKSSSLEEAKILLEGFLINDETIICAFQTIRDRIMFTNKRIVSVDVQGLVGKRKSYASLPYSKVQFFSVQTPGLTEWFPDSELYLMFSNGFTATFDFHDKVDMGLLARIIGQYMLE